MKRFLFCLLASCTQDFGTYELKSDAMAPSDAMMSNDTMTGDSGGCSGTTFMGHCYFLVTAASFSGTSTACMGQSAHLVTIGSAAEQTAVQGVGSGDRWIGLSRMQAQQPVDMNYVWVNGDPRTYANWAPGEPNGSGTAVRMRLDGTWADTSDTNSYPGICERP